MPRIVRISVSTSRGRSSASCSISVDPDPVPLAGIGHGNGARIHWDIVTPGWKFVATASTNGIAIANHGTKFTNKGDSNGGRRFTWQRDEVDEKTYQYTIRITDGTTMVAWDPSIVNS